MTAYIIIIIYIIIQQSLAKYSGLRMTQTVYGCGLALRVVCVNFLNTCPIAP